MKKLIALILSVFLVNALSAAIAVSPVIFDEAEFFEIPDGETIETYRSFHAEIYEGGNNKINNVEVGNGDFTSIEYYDVEPNWEVNTEYDFTLSYIAGEISFFVDGVGLVDDLGNTLPLTYQPTKPINKLFIGNDNNQALSFVGMEMTGMAITSGSETVSLVDLTTSGTRSGNDFQGLTVSGFQNDWSLTGAINFTADDNIIDHNSTFKFYGAVPEPSLYGLILGLSAIGFVLLKRRR